MELHTEEGIISGVPEAGLNDPGEERGVKKEVIPTMRMLKMTCAYVVERVHELTTMWLWLNGEI